MLTHVKLYSQIYAEQPGQNKTVTGEPVCNEAIRMLNNMLGLNVYFN